MSHRGTVPGLDSPHPLGPELPSLYQSDDLAQRFTAALDEVLAPIFTTLDCIDAYFDPHLAPDDFVAWVASWFGQDVQPTWSDERLRAFVADVVTIYRWYGTSRALAVLVRSYTGVEPAIIDSGGSRWAEDADATAPGDAVPSVTVRVRLDDPDRIDVTALRRVVSAAIPAHVHCEVEVSAP